MNLEQFATTLGLPGFFVLVWYLLEIQKGKRAEKAEDAKNKLEEKKIDALTAGFTSLNAKLDNHQSAEFEHHVKVREAVVGLHTSFAAQFDLTPPPQSPPAPVPKPAARTTPPRGTYFHRPGTKDDR